jgi:nucleoside-diphosphate-sugar epimerase
MNILITGATGFIGSHVAEAFLDAGHKLLLSKRTTSDLWRCNSFIEKVDWTNTDANNFENDVYNFVPEIIINCAWDGVSADKRNIWQVQINNLIYQQRLLNLAVQTKIKKFIGIGSQAEYGKFEGKIDESYPPNPDSSYGAIKLAAYTILKAFCNENDINWYWF